MANKWLDLFGTSLSKFLIGIGGPALKNNSGALDIRNATDTAWALMRALNIAVTGDSITLNEQATESGSSWKVTIARPSTGMTHDYTIVLPNTDPAVGQALTVAAFASNVITLTWTTIASGNEKIVTDTTSLAFGSTSPLAMFTLPANAIVLCVKVIIDTAFNGAPSLSVGVSGTTSKFMPSTAVDLTAAAGTMFEYTPNQASDASTENLIATYAAGSATAGAARILVEYCIPN